MALSKCYYTTITWYLWLRKKTITSNWFFFILDASSSGTSDKEPKDKNASNIFKILQEVDSAVEKKEYAKLAKILSEEKICRADIIPTFWTALKARDDKALDIIMNGGFTPNLNLLKVTISNSQKHKRGPNLKPLISRLAGLLKIGL